MSTYHRWSDLPSLFPSSTLQWTDLIWTWFILICIDPFHARHSIAVTVVMYHMTYERWRSSKKTESWIQAKCIAVRKMTWQLSRRLPQVSIAAFTEDFCIAEWLRSLTSNSAEWTNEAVAMTWRHWNVALERGLLPELLSTVRRLQFESLTVNRVYGSPYRLLTDRIAYGSPLMVQSLTVMWVFLPATVLRSLVKYCMPRITYTCMDGLVGNPHVLSLLWGSCNMYISLIAYIFSQTNGCPNL